MVLQMASVRLPDADGDVSRRLFDDHRVEIPVMGDLMRVSVAPYTTREDVERLLDALPRALIPRRSRTPR
jgi:selenocysteine lyase/cysteine desulfurase